MASPARKVVKKKRNARIFLTVWPIFRPLLTIP